MTTLAFLKIAVYFLLVLAVTKPLGLYMRRVFSGERTFLDPVLGPRRAARLPPRRRRREEGAGLEGVRLLAARLQRPRRPRRLRRSSGSSTSCR